MERKILELKCLLEHQILEYYIQPSPNNSKILFKKVILKLFFDLNILLVGFHQIELYFLIKSNLQNVFIYWRKNKFFVTKYNFKDNLFYFLLFIFFFSDFDFLFILQSEFIVFQSITIIGELTSFLC